MRIYRLPGIRVESRYHWNFASILIAIVVIVGLFIVSRWFASEAPRRVPMQSYYRPWVSQPMPSRYQQSPIRSRQSPIQMRRNSPINSEAFEIESEQPRVIGERLYPRKKRRRLTRAQRRNLVESQRGRCAICGAAFQANWDIQVDHKICIAACNFGYDESRVNLDDNLWALCLKCHAIKTASERSRGLYSRGT